MKSILPEPQLEITIKRLGLPGYWKIMTTSPDHIGKSIDAIVSQKVKVVWKNKDGKDEVCLVND